MTTALCRALVLLMMLGLAGPTLAVIETYEFADDSLLERYQELSFELRCPKCQNQNIADSNAPIAADLRKQLHAQLQAGRSDKEIIEYMVDRYGEFVLYRPRWNKVTVVLWLAPAILLLLAIGILISSIRGRGAAASSALNPEEQARLDRLLAEARNQQQGATQEQ